MRAPGIAATLLLGCLLLLPSCSTEHRVTFEADPQPVEKTEVVPLPIGAEAPEFNLPGVDGKYYTLDDFADAKLLLVIFTCNHCPTAQAYEDRISQIAQDYASKDLQVVCISPNSPISLLYEELGYSDLNDDFEAMVIRAEHKNFTFPYLYDGDTHEASLQYGPATTPHAYLFDQERKLRYRGMIDGSEKPGTANAEILRTAINAVMANREIIRPETKTFGCSVKWAWKTEYKDRVNQEWSDKPVTLEVVDLDSLKTVLTNLSNKIRLVNFWATWCGPCKLEFPEFLKMQRMYGQRPFEFVSVSLDNIEKKEEALMFLQGIHSPVANYLCNEKDKQALIDKVHPEWQGDLPFTMLIDPLGAVVKAWHGTVDPLDVKRTIVEHRFIGRYY